MRHLTWKNVFLTLLGASLVLIAGFYATGIDGFVVASAITLIFLLLAAWVWAIQSLIVRGYRWLVAGYIVVLLCAALVSVSGFYVTGIGDLAITGAIAITLLLLAAWVWIIRLRRVRRENVTCEVTK